MVLCCFSNIVLLLSAGTNAHLILASGDHSNTAMMVPANNNPRLQLSWHFGRHWYMPPVSPLVNRVFSSTTARGTPLVLFQARVSHASNAVLLTNSTVDSSSIVLPAAALLMLAAGVADASCHEHSQLLDPTVQLVQSVFGQVVYPKQLAGSLELAVVLQPQQGSVAISTTSSNPTNNMALSTNVRRVSHQSGPAAASDTISSLPGFLTAIIDAAQQQHDQMPGPIIKGQVAATRGKAPGPSEPVIAAVCQMEASLVLPQFAAAPCSGNAVSLQLPASLDSCMLHPRGFGPDSELDLVDPDVPQHSGGVPVRSSNFWISSTSTGIMMQLQGVAYRSLKAAQQRSQPLGAAADAALLDANIGQLALTSGALQSTAADMSQPDNVETECTYVVDWLAAAVPAADTVAQTTRLQLTLSASGALVQGLSSSLQIMQSAQGGTLDTQLHTTGAHTLSAPTRQQPVSGSSTASSLPWALMRAVMHEQPGWQLTAMDVSLQAPSSRGCSNVSYGVGQVSAAAGGGRDLYGCTLAAGTLYSSKISKAPIASSAVQPAEILQGDARYGTYIITGGSGAVGSIIAKWLLDQLGVQHVHLVSRSGAIPQELANIWRHSSSSAAHRYLVSASKADTAVAGDSALLDMLVGSHLPVMGVVHAAGVLSDGLLSQQTPSSISKVLAPKLAAMQHLQNVVVPQPTNIQLLLSSVAAMLGSPGQCNYAAANAGLDAAAHSCTSAGVPCCSIQTGAWAGSGMALKDSQTAARAARMGISMLQPKDALSAMSHAMSASWLVTSQPSAQLAVVPVNWPAYLSKLGHQPPGAFFDNFVSNKQATAAQPRHAGAESRRTAQQARQRALQAVTDVVTSILGDDVPIDQPLMVSLSSFMSLNVRSCHKITEHLQLGCTYQTCY